MTRCSLSKRNPRILFLQIRGQNYVARDVIFLKKYLISKRNSGSSVVLDEVQAQQQVLEDNPNSAMDVSPVPILVETVTNPRRSEKHITH